MRELKVPALCCLGRPRWFVSVWLPVLISPTWRCCLNLSAPPLLLHLSRNPPPPHPYMHIHPLHIPPVVFVSASLSVGCVYQCSFDSVKNSLKPGYGASRLVILITLALSSQPKSPLILSAACTVSSAPASWKRSLPNSLVWSLCFTEDKDLKKLYIPNIYTFILVKWRCSSMSWGEILLGKVSVILCILRWTWLPGVESEARAKVHQTCFLLIFLEWKLRRSDLRIKECSSTLLTSLISSRAHLTVPAA